MKKTIFLALAVSCAALFLACASVPTSIPESLTVDELVQRAQEASDAYNYAAAVAYYQAAMDRFGADPAVLCMGEYETAFIYYKQGRYPASVELFNKLLARYDAPGGQSLPPRYRILAEKVLAKIQASSSSAKH